MTTFNTDYNNTELLDQELTTAELSQVSGGLVVAGPLMDPVINKIQAMGESIGKSIYEAAKQYVNQKRPIGL